MLLDGGSFTCPHPPPPRPMYPLAGTQSHDATFTSRTVSAGAHMRDITEQTMLKGQRSGGGRRRDSRCAVLSCDIPGAKHRRRKRTRSSRAKTQKNALTNNGKPAPSRSHVYCTCSFAILLEVGRCRMLSSTYILYFFAAVGRSILFQMRADRLALETFVSHERRLQYLLEYQCYHTDIREQRKKGG